MILQKLVEYHTYTSNFSQSIHACSKSSGDISSVLQEEKKQWLHLLRMLKRDQHLILKVRLANDIKQRILIQNLCL